METYRIEVIEILSRVVDVKALSSEDAISTINKSYKKSEIVLDADDFIDVNFIDINKKEDKNQLIKDIIEYLYIEEKKHFEENDQPENHIFNKIEKLKMLID